MAIEFPANPSDEDSFVANNVTYIYDGTLGVWNIYSGTTYNGGFGGSGGASVTIGDSAPTSPSNGDMWWESDVGRLKIYYDDGDTAQWVDATPTSNTVGGSNSVIAPTAIGIINGTSGTGTGLSWSNWDAVAGTLDITFDNAQPDADYAVVTDGEFQDDGRMVSVQSKTTAGFEISLYDGSGNVNTPSALNLFTIIVYASTPTQLVQTNPYSDGNVDTHLNVSGATTGEVLSWTGTDYDWVTAASGGGASVTTSDTAPSNPSEGDLWYDTTELTTYVYYNDGNSSQWVNASPNGMSASLNISDTAPTNPSDGDLWFDSTALKTFVYYNDGSSSQWVTLVPTAGGTGGGVTTYADTATMVAETPDAGSLGFVTANNNLYLYNGSGWGKVNVTNVAPVINSVQDASANTTPFNLATDGTPTVITVGATDAEGFPLTYTYSVSSGTVGTTATIVQGTGAQANEFTLTPGTNDPADAGSFDLTFTVDDGYASVDSTASFSLSFVTAGLFGDRAVVWREGGAGSAGIEYTSITTGANTASFGNSRPDGTDGIATTDAIYSVHTVTYNYTTSQYLLDVDYVTIGTLGNASLLGNLSTVHRHGQGTNDDTYCVWAQGYNETNANSEIRETTQIDYMTTQTGGNAGDFGNVSWHSSSVIEAITDGTRAILGGGYKTGVSWTSDLEYVTIQTPGNAASWGNRTYSGGEAGGTSDGATRGLWFGGYGPPSNANYNYIDYVTLGGNTSGGASSFGTLTGSLFNPGTATSDGTYAIAVSNNGGNYVDVVTIATAGNATNFGGVTLFSSTYTASSGT